ncbi:NAD-dependent epimerase/dehydratase family protein [Persicobacter psychrovividus]|uniref:Nucleoside-diphosphate sugar epimerase n=1 Tax=Persicobacter psychrovividus TaxID=387638 RepID=A0ABN6LAE4_9BACT|nr:nucleoside-diphosphate sugar epimerase [Persicobacter psychrovividus]
MSKKTAVVIGATGLIGGHLMKHLIQDDQYREIVVLGRRPPASSHPKIHFVTSNFQLSHLTHELPAHFDEVFCCIGTTIKKAGSQKAFRAVDYNIPLHLAKAAHHKGCPHFLLISSLGASPKSKAFYSKVKGELEEAIKEVGFEQFSVLRPSLLLGDRKETRLMEEIGKLLSPVLNLILVGSLKKYRAIEASTVAEKMYQVAQYETSGNHVYENQELLT